MRYKTAMVRKSGRAKRGRKVIPVATDGPKGPELFIGLIGPVGVDLNGLSRALEEAFTQVRYSTKTLHLIEHIHLFQRWRTLPEDKVEERYNSHIKAGDEFREAFELGDALTRLSMHLIREQHRKKASSTRSVSEPLSRCAYIFRSLKHPDEVKLLRDVYGPNFYLFAAYSPRETRLKEFTKKIADSHHATGQAASRYESDAAKILELDQAEPDKKWGQNLRETFPEADVFINVTDRDTVRTDVTRFIELIFNNTQHIYTPTRDEYGMFLARAAALRSSALGRQVGAAISNDDGDIIALGTNDVPKFGGGLYWPGPNDHRDFKEGEDTSDKMKRIQFEEVIESLKKHGWFSAAKAAVATAELVKEAMPLMKSTRLMSLIEFGRNVHAEMAALLDAAARGVSVKDCTLYTTTFPCHDCARHIVAAGIKRVAYIEPYPKSLALDFHKDSIVVDPHGESRHKVRFEQFVGISPNRYIDLFTAGRRKSIDGALIPWDKTRALPRSAQPVLSYMHKETEAVALFATKREERSISFV